MTCRHDFNWSDEAYYAMPSCDIHVDCDENCKALTEPETIDELRAALEHWEAHQYLSGCSHGC